MARKRKKAITSAQRAARRKNMAIKSKIPRIGGNHVNTGKA